MYKNSAEIITKLNKMEQEKINYDEIMALGFTEDMQSDSVYEAKHGYSYCIITKQLTKKIYLDWVKETKLCKMVRLEKPKTGDIGAELPIKNLGHLKEMINFFSDEKEQTFD
jgi:hypothetical protein